MLIRRKKVYGRSVGRTMAAQLNSFSLRAGSQYLHKLAPTVRALDPTSRSHCLTLPHYTPLLQGR